MAVIHINGERYEVEGGKNLLQTCLELGLDVPHFCYHPALGAVGSCRQCAVKQYNNAEDEQAGRGRLVMSCTVETTDDLYISVDEEEAKSFRAAMIELLMTNHPHDCPTCEEGGQCQLQDMTVMSGHHDRNYRFTKRTHNNQYLGPFINHEANRCIACYRCVRYYQNYAGGTDLGVFASASRVFFGRHEDGILESEFAGNLTEVCPTGVFTDKSHSIRYNRKWDMQYSPSICHGCAAGCNISAGERYGELRRIENRYHSAINGYFLCDRGRFGYGFVNQPDRPKSIRIARSKATAEQAIQYVSALLINGKTIGIGSDLASLESNYLLKSVVGKDHFYTALAPSQIDLIQTAIALQQEVSWVPSMLEVEACDAILILGEDITQTAARLALSVRQAAKNKGKAMAYAMKTPDFLEEPVRRTAQDELSPIYIASCHATKLDDIAQNTLISDVDGILHFAKALVLTAQNQQPTDDPFGIFALASTIIEQFKQAKKPLIISGTSLGSQKLMDYAATLAQLIPNCGLNLIVPNVNSVGLASLNPQSLENAMLDEVENVILLENELDQLPQSFVDELYQKRIIALNHQHSKWIDEANVILPTATFAESEGTVMNYHLFVQRFYKTFEPSYYDLNNELKEGWRWLYAIKQYLKTNQIDWGNLDLVISDMAKNEPTLAEVERAAPLATFKMHKMKIARTPLRYSGRVAMRAPISVQEPKQPQDPDSALAYSMEGYQGQSAPGPLIPFAWAAGWNSPQAWHKYLAANGKVKGGEGGIQLTQKLTQWQFSEPERPQYHYINQNLNQSFNLVPLYDLFASAPQRHKLPLFDERNRPYFVKMTPKTAKTMGLRQGDELILTHQQKSKIVALKIEDDFAEDCIGIVLENNECLDEQITIEKKS